MAGAYCQFCDHRCFVERWVPGHGALHLATCSKGRAHDLDATGYDASTALNPLDPLVREYVEQVATVAAVAVERAQREVVGVVGAALIGDPAAARRVTEALTRAGFDTWNRDVEDPDA